MNTHPLQPYFTNSSIENVFVVYDKKNEPFREALEKRFPGRVIPGNNLAAHTSIILPDEITGMDACKEFVTEQFFKLIKMALSFNKGGTVSIDRVIISEYNGPVKRPANVKKALSVNFHYRINR